MVHLLDAVVTMRAVSRVLVLTGDHHTLSAFQVTKRVVIQIERDLLGFVGFGEVGFRML